MENRFIKVYAQKQSLGTEHMEIWVDRVTGVQYLFRSAGYSGGLTPLLDRDGRPAICSDPDIRDLN